jgi:RNA polymerase-binding transcription factor DksA
MQPQNTRVASVDPRAALQRRRAELLTRSRRLDRDLSHSTEPLVQDFADQAVQRQNDETLEAIGQAAAEELRQIDRALERIAEGRYGICEACGQPIAEGRLRAVPYAATCVGCG